MKPFLSVLFAAGLMTPAVFAADGSWVTPPEKSYAARNVHVDDVFATLLVDVKPVSKVSVQISGEAARVQTVKVDAQNNVLTISGVDESRKHSVWDWRKWFDFHKHGGAAVDKLKIHIVVPDKTPLEIADFAGNAKIGSTHGAFRFETSGSGNAVIGDVADAEVALAGAGKVRLGHVAGALKASTAGSGSISAGDVDSLHSEVAGSGSVVVANIRHGLHHEVAGSGDMSAASVHGEVHVEIAGSGSVKIGSGEANPFRVEIMGSGNVRFGGVAHDPHVEAMGSGNVWIKSYTGKLDTEGNAHLKIGD